nr:CBS domain-containing protein [Candidatus Njordarchaeum guaymaensis]
MLVKDLMVENPITIDKDQLVSFAIDLMRKKRVSRLPVMDGGNLVGIVTERDIVARLSSSGAAGLSASSLRVPSAMTSNPRTISPEADATEAAKEMIARGISSLAVVDGESHLVGIITKTRLLRICLKVNKIYVGQIMTKNPVSISPNARLVNVTRLLFEKDLSVIPVVDKERTVGIVTDGLIALAMFNIFDKADRKHLDKQIRQLTVSSAMRPAPPFSRPDSKVKDAAKTMIEERLKGLPVLDYKERLVGIVSKTDMTRLVSNKFEVQLP